MPTANGSDGGHNTSGQRRRGDVRPKRDGSSARRRGASGTTGSLSATNPGRARTNGTTGSLSATNPGRVRSNGAVGYKSAASGRRRGRRSPSHAARPQRGFPVWGIVLVVVLAIGLGVGGFFVVRHIIHPYEGAKVEDGQTVTVVIPEGSSGANIISTLLDAGVIHSSSDFRKAVQAQNADQSLRSGTYTFETGSDPAEVVSQLVAGPNSSEGQLQVPEGLTVVQTAALVESSLGIPADDFLEQAKASNYVDEFAFLSAANNDSLEGFLYPKTYDLAGRDATADTVIRLMLAQYDTEIAQGLDLDAARATLSERYDLNVTDYDVLKIASIIDKEAINEDDRPKVSSVFYNRLSDGMALQSDATMGYETGGVVTAEDLSTDSPYNTYLYKGLPPTPICSPSKWAIEAAMEPADTDYLYFFIIESGDYSNHTFSLTFEEHDAAYAAALEEQASVSASSASDDESSASAAGDADAEGLEDAEE